MFALLGAAASPGLAQTEDRYSDWRPEASSSAAHSEVTEAPPRSIGEVAAQPIETTPDFQAPLRAPRKLPFRFERAPARADGSRVVLASATEPSKLLPKPSSTTRGEKQTRKSSGFVGGASGSMISVAGSVAVVVGLFLIVAWMARRGAGSIPPTLPRDALEVLGRKRFAGKQEMQLVRLGSKLVLIHVVPGHAEALCEITDPAEVDRLTGICYQLHPRSSTKNFRETFDKFAQERPAARPAARTATDKLDLSIFDSVGRRTS
jgi:flagellar biogenesis protein FliO